MELITLLLEKWQVQLRRPLFFVTACLPVYLPTASSSSQMKTYLMLLLREGASDSPVG